MTAGHRTPEQVAAKKAHDVALAESILASRGPRHIPSIAAVTAVSAVLTMPHKIILAVAGYSFALGKRPVDHAANLVHDGMLAIPTCGVFMRDALTQHASIAAFGWLGLRERSITTAELRALGFAVPPGRARFRWVVFRTPAERQVYADAHDMLVALGLDAPHPEQDATPWLPFAADRIPAPGDKHAPCQCPFHDDAKASAAIFPASPRGFGAGVCHACTGPDGMPLRFCWRELPDGSLGVRIARRHREGSNEWKPEEAGKNVGRYNGGPIGPVKPSASLVRTLHGVTLGVGLRTIDRSMTLSGHGSGAWASVTSNSPLRGDVLDAIVRSDRNADYGNIRAKIVDHEFESAARMERDPTRPNNVDVRDRLIRVQPQFSTYVDVMPWGDVPSGWKDVGVAHVLLDLDGLRLGDDAAARAWAADVLGIVLRDPRCSGRVTVVRTSAGGAQVVVELARPIAGRIPGEAWWTTDGARGWYRTLGDRMLAAAHARGAEGGEIDWSAFAPCRLARRPGWRVCRDGTTYRAHLLAARLDVAAAAAAVTLAA